MGGSKKEEEGSFPQILNELNRGPTAPKEIPPLHPQPDELVDISKEESLKQMQNQLIAAKKVRANYRVFNITNDEQREELEEIMDHILRDGWFLGYEEKQIMPNGTAIVFLKYFIPDEPVKKSSAADVADAKAK